MMGFKDLHSRSFDRISAANFDTVAAKRNNETIVGKLRRNAGHAKTAFCTFSWVAIKHLENLKRRRTKDKN
jgi:hypothetical protein